MKFLNVFILTLLFTVSSGRIRPVEPSSDSVTSIEEFENAGLGFDEESRSKIEKLIERGAFSKIRVDDVLDLDATVGNAMQQAKNEDDRAFDTGDTRNLLVCPGTCNPLAAWGWATSMKITIEHTVTPQFCVDFTCDCDAKWKCLPNVGCKFCCGGFCYSFISQNTNYCCRIDGINGLNSNTCFYSQLCGS